MSLTRPAPAEIDRFAVAIVQGASNSDALRGAFTKAKGYKPETVHSYASRWRSLDTVATRIKELEADGRETARLTVEQHVKELRALSVGAESKGQYGAAVSATKATGQVAGLYEPGGIDEQANIPTGDVIRMLACGRQWAETALNQLFSGNFDGFDKALLAHYSDSLGVKLIEADVADEQEN